MRASIFLLAFVLGAVGCQSFRPPTVAVMIGASLSDKEEREKFQKELITAIERPSIIPDGSELVLIEQDDTPRIAWNGIVRSKSDRAAAIAELKAIPTGKPGAGTLVTESFELAFDYLSRRENCGEIVIVGAGDLIQDPPQGSRGPVRDPAKLKWPAFLKRTKVSYFGVPEARISTLQNAWGSQLGQGQVRLYGPSTHFDPTLLPLERRSRL